MPAGMVEKDYWVVQCLKAIRSLGWGIHFKGGTSLSKGFGIIERFSEDLDLKLEPTGDWTLPADHDWRSKSKQAVDARTRFFDRLARALVVPGCQTREEARDPHGRSVNLRVGYPMVTERPPPPLAEGVLLEIGHARVTPSELRPIRSWVTEFARSRQAELVGFDLDPVEIRCVLPAVSLLEKVEALCRHYSGEKDAAKFIRHYEDAAAIARFLVRSDADAAARLGELHEEMVSAGDIRPLHAEADALRLTDPDRNAELEDAWRAAEGLHWGERMGLGACAEVVRNLLRSAGIGS